MKGFTSNIVWGTFTQPREQSKNMPTLMQTFFFKQQNPWRVSLVCSWFIFFWLFLKLEQELIISKIYFGLIVFLRSFTFAFGPHVRIAHSFFHLFDALICCFFDSFFVAFYTFFGTFFDVFLTLFFDTFLCFSDFHTLFELNTLLNCFGFRLLVALTLFWNGSWHFFDNILMVFWHFLSPFQNRKLCEILTLGSQSIATLS